MKKIGAWLRKNKKKMLIADAVLIIAACVILVSIASPSEVSGLQVTDSTYSTVDISWDPSDNAASYRVYRSKDGVNFKYLTTTTDTEYKDKKLRTGRTYYYAVTARNGLKTTGIDEEKAASVKPSLEVPKLKVDTTQGEMKLSYTAVDGALGYEIIRNGEVIGQSEKTEFIDEQASTKGGEYKYEVRAFRYEDDPVFSKASETVTAEVHALQNFTVAASDDDLLIKWTRSDHYSNYKIYSSDEVVAETGDNSFRLADFEVGKVYDIKIVGFTSDGSEQSPDIGKRFKVVEEEMTNEEAISAAVQWGIDIANDDSFTYGTGDRSHRYGCYFCQTNVGPRKNIKGKSKVNGHSYEKTYCCNPFVHACYAHGAGDPAMLKACQNGHGIAMTTKSFTRYGHWENVGKVSKGNLKKGDVLVRSNHVMLYIGDGQIVHAAGGGWDAGSIKVTNLGGRKYTFVMRYTGNGRGSKYVIKEVDDLGNPIEDRTEAIQS